MRRSCGWLACALAACAITSGAAAGTTRAAAEPAGPATGGTAGSPIAQVLDLGPAFRGADPTVLGLDGAFSLPLGGGTSEWVFGDTLRGRWLAAGRRSIARIPSSSAAVVQDGRWVTGFGSAHFAPAPPLEPSAPNLRIWPLDLVRAGGRDWLFAVEVEATGEGPLDFRVAGVGVASRPAGHHEAFGRPVRLWPGEAPLFGTSVLVREGSLLVFAGGAEAHLARAPLDRLADPAAYRYHRADGTWGPGWRTAAALPGLGPEASVRWNGYLGAFVMVGIPPGAHEVALRLAARPEGPWGPAIPVATCQPAGDREALWYGAKQHAELDADGGRTVVLSYNNNVAAPRLGDRPDLYWPHLLRVTFWRLPGALGRPTLVGSPNPRR